MINNTIDSSVISKMNGTSSSSSSSSSTQNTAEALQSNFMTLLTTQLQNQDPLQPMDNSQMVTQLAQINTVSGIQSLNATLQGITGQISESEALQAATLVGKGVLVPGDQIKVGSGVATPFGVELTSAADSVSVSIADSSGTVVRQYDLGALDAGVHSFSWDATQTDGSQAADGAYTVTIKASSKGQALTSTTLDYAQVSGVTRSDKGPLLNLGAVQGTVALSDVRQVL